MSPVAVDWEEPTVAVDEAASAAVVDQVEDTLQCAPVPGRQILKARRRKVWTVAALAADAGGAPLASSDGKGHRDQNAVHDPGLHPPRTTPPFERFVGLWV